MYNRNTYFFYCCSSPYNSFLISVLFLAHLIKTVIWPIALTWHPSSCYIWFCRPESFIIQQEIIFADHNYPHSADYADVIYTNTKNVLSTTNKMEKKSCFPCFYRFLKIQYISHKYNKIVKFYIYILSLMNERFHIILWKGKLICTFWNQCKFSDRMLPIALYL